VNPRTAERVAVLIVAFAVGYLIARMEGRADDYVHIESWNGRSEIRVAAGDTISLGHLRIIGIVPADSTSVRMSVKGLGFGASRRRP